MNNKSDQAIRRLRKRIAENTARLRAEKDLTYKKLAERSGIHWRHLQKIEANEGNITLKTIARLAKGLGVDEAVLVASVSRSVASSQKRPTIETVER